MVDAGPRRDEVWLAILDSTQGPEIQKTRPCVIVSPDEMNCFVRTIIVAPMTTADRPYPTRTPVRFQGETGHIALDQIRAVDRTRLVKKLGSISPRTADSVSSLLVEMFSRTR